MCEEIVKAPLSRSGTLISGYEYEVNTHEHEEGPEPTEEEYKTLREVSDKVPYAAYLVILIEFCERFTYYGLSGPFQNYIQYPDPGECESLYSFLSFPLFLFYPVKLNIMLLPLLQILPNSPVLWVKVNKSLQPWQLSFSKWALVCIIRVTLIRKFYLLLASHRFWCYITPVNKQLPLSWYEHRLSNICLFVVFRFLVPLWRINILENTELSSFSALFTLSAWSFSHAHPYLLPLNRALPFLVTLSPLLSLVLVLVESNPMSRLWLLSNTVAVHLLFARLKMELVLLWRLKPPIKRSLLSSTGYVYLTAWLCNTIFFFSHG